MVFVHNLDKTVLMEIVKVSAHLQHQVVGVKEKVITVIKKTVRQVLRFLVVIQKEAIAQVQTMNV